MTDHAEGPRPPEWWTEENTAQWQAERWGNPEEWDGAMRTWGGKIRDCPNRPVSRATLVAPISPKQYKAWAKTETRPIPITFYDGTIDPKRCGLVRGSGRAA